MSQASSLALLTGNQTNIGSQLPDADPDTEAEAAEAEETIDVDTMNTKEIEQLVKDYAIETPKGWSKFKLAEKRQWLNDNFGDDEEDEAPVDEGSDQAAEEQAEEQAPQTATPVGETISPQTPAGDVAPKTKPDGAVEQPGENILADLVHEIENMDEATALDAALSLTEQTEMHMFKLGGVLAAIQANNWYEPYQSFKEFCEGKLGMHYRKASYWAAIYNDLVEANINWSQVAGIGWSKLKEIVSVIDQDNVAAWVDTAKNQTTIQLIETVKAYKQGHSGQIGSHGGDVVSTKTFKLHADQKQTVEDALKKAKDEAGTTYDTAALEFICMDYMGSQKLAAKLKKIGTDHALAALEEAFPELDIEVSLAQDEAS